MNKIQLKTDRGKAGLVRTNIAYVLVDAANSLLLDAGTDFKAEGLVINRETKQKTIRTSLRTSCLQPLTAPEGIQNYWKEYTRKSK